MHENCRAGGSDGVQAGHVVENDYGELSEVYGKLKQRQTEFGAFVGLFSRRNRAPLISVDELRLPEQLSTDVPGLVLTKMPAGQRVDIEVVGESFRQDAVRAVAEVADGADFDIYLLPDPNNSHDRNAVRVMVGNLHVGFLPRNAARVWRKRCQEAMDRGQLIWGEGRAASRSGELWGIFGFVWMPPVANPSADVKPRELDSAGIEKARDVLQPIINGGDPETLSQLKSLVKKASKAVMPLYAHTLWLADEDRFSDEWEEVQGLVEDVFELVAEAEYADDPDDFDVASLLEDILVLLEDVTEK